MEPRRSITVFIALLSPAALATAVHCGGGDRGFAAEASADGTGGDGAGDAATSDDACVFGLCDEPRPPGPFAPCPRAAPEAGTPCTTEGESCEYGADFFIACDPVFACGDGVWHALGGTCFPPFPEAGDAGCPATWSEASAFVGTGSCPARDCQYPEGYCVCGSYCSSIGQIRPQVSGAWECKALPAGCPSPRPIVGAACDTDGGGCDYGWPCGCGETQRCVEGVWQGQATPVCP